MKSLWFTYYILVNIRRFWKFSLLDPPKKFLNSLLGNKHEESQKTVIEQLARAEG